MAITRRGLFAGIGFLAAGNLFGQKLSSGASACGTGGYHPILLSQTFIWAQHFRSHNIGLSDGIEQMCSAIQQAGFRRIELMGGFLAPALRSKTLRLLKQHSLELTSVYHGSSMHDEAAAEQSIADIVLLVSELKGAGIRSINIDPSPRANHELKGDQELALQARSLNRLGAELKRHGVRLMIHHHTPELASGAHEWRYELEHTDPSLVFLCVDVDWAVRGGQSPLRFIQACGERLAELHLRNDQKGIWMEDFGPGDIDYAPVAGYLKEICYKGYLTVELAYEEGTKATKPLGEDLKQSRSYAEKIFDLSRP